MKIKRDLFCECGNVRPRDGRYGCLRCREIENRRKLDVPDR